jgi:hypothetical protein
MYRLIIFFFVLAFSFPDLQAQTTWWAGDFATNFDRVSSALEKQCNFEKKLEGNLVTFDSWVRTRAVVRNLCFQVYLRGITDQGNSPKQLAVYLAYRDAQGDKGPARIYPARFVEKVGNNFAYLVDLTDFDPMLHPPQAPNGNTYTQVTMDVYAYAVGPDGQHYYNTKGVTVRFME